MPKTNTQGIETYIPWEPREKELLYQFLSRIKDPSIYRGVWVDPKNIDVDYRVDKVDANHHHLVCIGTLKDLSCRAVWSCETIDHINFEEILFSFRNEYSIDDLVEKHGINGLKWRYKISEELPEPVLDAIKSAEEEFLRAKSLANAKYFVENEVPKIIERAKKSMDWSNFIRKVSVDLSTEFEDEGMEGHAPSTWVFVDEDENVMKLRDTIYLKRRRISNTLDESIQALVKYLKGLSGDSICCVCVASDGRGLWEINVYDHAD